MQPWTRIEPTKTSKVGWRTVLSKTFKMPDGSTAVFDTLHPDGQEFVSVIALTPNNKVVVAKQYRSGPEKFMYELPGGFVDKGESPEESIRRELLEETGYRSEVVSYSGAFHKDTYMNAVWHVFVAPNCLKDSEQKLEDEEFIDVQEISIEQLIFNAKNDAMTDHAAVLMVYDELMKLKEKNDETTN